MNVDEQIRRVLDQMNAASSAFTPEMRGAVDQLSVLMVPALRLAMQSVLEGAAGDLSEQLRGTAEVYLELNGGEPALVGRPDPTAEQLDSSGPELLAPETSDLSDDTTARFTLRVPQVLKVQAEAAAKRSGISLNSWVVQAIGSALNPNPVRHSRALRGWLG